jgi:serine/threonine protein kinase/tetratricopeptide (TPR) repeat protein
MEGQRIGPYRLEHLLGAGGMGPVYSATVDRRTTGLEQGTRVAVKVIHDHLLETPEFLERFRREAAIGRSVDHPNVVRTLDCHIVDEGGRRRAVLVMELVEGQTLRDLMQDLGRVPEALCRHVGEETARGLAAIHAAGAIHRDLKPDNVLITLDHRVKVMDLGVARLVDEVVRLSQTGSFVGSIHYSAPEQFGKGLRADHRADLHALGLVLYELACSRHPFQDDDFRVVMHEIAHTEAPRIASRNPVLTPFFDEVVHVLLAKDPAQRFRSAAEVAHVLSEGERSSWWSRRARQLRALDRPTLRRVRVPHETAHYGRESQTHHLMRAFAAARSGEGHVMLLEGEAGIGKSRLVDELVARLEEEEEEFHLLYGAYPPGGAATGAGAFSTAYREHFGIDGLETELSRYLSVTPLLVPAFAAVLLGDSAPADAMPLTTESLHTAFVHVTRSLAAEKPTVVVIEDLHLTPEEGRAIFAALAMSVPGHRILLVGTFRPGVPSAWVADVERLPHADRVLLPRLGPKDLMHLLHESFRSETLARQLGHQIAVKSDGNPYFAFEIIRGLREAGWIEQRDDGSWAGTRVIEDIDIPSSVLDLIQGWIADLDEAEKDLLDVASCCGFEFDALLVASVLGIDQIPAMKRLARLEKKHRLVRSVGRRFVFDHHQVREAIHQGLPPLLREPYHLAIAEALERRESADASDADELDGALAVELCEHFLAGAAGVRGARYLSAALDHLEDGYLNDQAVSLAERFLDCPGLLAGRDRARVLVRTAERLELLGRLEAARIALDEALPLGEELGDDRILAEALVTLGQQMHQVGEYDESIPVLQRGADVARRAGRGGNEVRAISNLGNIAFRQGRYADAQRLHETALELARETGIGWGETVAFGNLGNVMWAQGRTDEAARAYRQALELAESREDRRAAASATGNLANVFQREGRHVDALDWNARARKIAREIGNRQGEAITSVNRATMLSPVGRYEEARQSAELGLELARETGFALVEAHAIGQLANIAEAQGDHPTAERLHRDAIAQQRRLGARDLFATQMAALGALLGRVGRHREARDVLHEAMAAFDDTGIRRHAVLATCHLAQLPGEDAEAALELFRQHGQELSNGDRMLAQFLLWRATGEHAWLREAHALLIELADRVGAENAESMRANVPLCRWILSAVQEHPEASGGRTA